MKSKKETTPSWQEIQNALHNSLISLNNFQSAYFAGGLSYDRNREWVKEVVKTSHKIKNLMMNYGAPTKFELRFETNDHKSESEMKRTIQNYLDTLKYLESAHLEEMAKENRGKLIPLLKRLDDIFKKSYKAFNLAAFENEDGPDDHDMWDYDWGVGRQK